MGTGGNLELAHGDAEVLGRAQSLGVIAEAVLGLGDAHRQVTKAVLAQLGELALGSRRKVDAIGAVDLGGNGLQGVGHIGTVLVGKLELARLLNQAHDLISQVECALAALGPNLGQLNVDAELLALGLDERKFGLGVRREAVDGDHAGKTIDVLDVVDVTQQVGHAGLKGLEVLVVEVGLGDTAVVLKRAGSGDNHDSAGANARHAALDVQELLGTKVGAKAGLGNRNVTKTHGHAGGHDGVAAVGDIGEGTAVDKRGRALERLHQVGLERILKQRGHGALGLKVAGADGLAGIAVADDDLAQALLKIVDARGQAQDCHDLGGNGDIEAVLARHALGFAANAIDNMAQLTVVHVDDALPGDALNIDAELVALLNMVVEHGGQQVVGGTDSVEVSGKVQVDVLHGDDLGPAAAGGTALYAKDGTERRFAQGNGALDAATTQTVGQTDGRGGLALACRRGIDSGHEDKLGLVIGRLVEQ